MPRLLLKGCSALVAAGLLLQPLAFSAARAADRSRPVVTGQPDPNQDTAPYYSDPAADPRLSNEEVIELLRRRVKYVFVLFQENRSFDHHLGALGFDGGYPSAKGID